MAIYGKPYYWLRCKILTENGKKVTEFLYRVAHQSFLLPFLAIMHSYLLLFLATTVIWQIVATCGNFNMQSFIAVFGNFCQKWQYIYFCIELLINQNAAS